MQRVPNHPHVFYRAGPDRHGIWHVECQCAYCGDRWRKPCHYPERTNFWIYRYSTLHGHGLRPVHAAMR